MSADDPDTAVAFVLRVLSPEAALALIEWRGGTRLYIPRDASGAAHEALASHVGVPAALALAEAFRGEYLKVPLAKTWRARLYRARGESYAEIARRLGCTESAVWRHLARTPAAPPAPRGRDPRQRTFGF